MNPNSFFLDFGPKLCSLFLLQYVTFPIMALLEILAIQSNSLTLEDKVPPAKLCHILSTLCLAKFSILSVFCGSAFNSFVAISYKNHVC